MRKLFSMSLAAALITAFAVGAFAQAQNQGRSGSSGQSQQQRSYTFQLTSMVRQIEEINKDSKSTLTAAQAKKVLAVLNPLRSKPKLTEDQAKTALKNLKPIFTTAQLNAMARVKSPQRGEGFRSPGQQNRPGQTQGQRTNREKPGANRPTFDANAMKDFNPFYNKVSSDNKFAAERAKRWDPFFNAMNNKAKGIKQAPAKTPAKKAPAKSTKPAASNAKKTTKK